MSNSWSTAQDLSSMSRYVTSSAPKVKVKSECSHPDGVLMASHMCPSPWDVPTTQIVLKPQAFSMSEAAIEIDEHTPLRCTSAPTTERYSCSGMLSSASLMS